MLTGTINEELEDFVGVKFDCMFAIAEGS